MPNADNQLRIPRQWWKMPFSEAQPCMADNTLLSNCAYRPARRLCRLCVSPIVHGIPTERARVRRMRLTSDAQHCGLDNCQSLQLCGRRACASAWTETHTLEPERVCSDNIPSDRAANDPR